MPLNQHEPHSPYDESIQELARQLERDEKHTLRIVAVLVVLVGVMVIAIAMFRAV